MNAKPILVVILWSGCATAAAQHDTEYALQANLIQRVTFDFDCTLTLEDGGQSAPFRAKAADPMEAKRNAILEAQRRTLALAPPASARCDPVVPTGK